MTAELNTRDALIAEMLGDVGKLHDAVGSLKTVLPEELEKFAAENKKTVTELLEASASYKNYCTNTFETATKLFTEKSKSDINNILQSSLAEFEKSISNALEKAKSKNRKISVERLDLVIIFGLCLFFAVIGSAIGYSLALDSKCTASSMNEVEKANEKYKPFKNK